MVVSTELLTDLKLIWYNRKTPGLGTKTSEFKSLFAGRWQQDILQAVFTCPKLRFHEIYFGKQTTIQSVEIFIICEGSLWWELTSCLVKLPSPLNKKGSKEQFTCIESPGNVNEGVAHWNQYSSRVSWLEVSKLCEYQCKTANISLSNFTQPCWNLVKC